MERVEYHHLTDKVIDARSSGETSQLEGELLNNIQDIVLNSGAFSSIHLLEGPNEHGEEGFDLYLTEVQTAEVDKEKAVADVVDLTGLLTSLVEDRKRVTLHLVDMDRISTDELKKRLKEHCEDFGQRIAYSADIIAA